MISFLGARMLYQYLMVDGHAPGVNVNNLGALQVRILIHYFVLII